MTRLESCCRALSGAVITIVLLFACIACMAIPIAAVLFILRVMGVDV